MLNGLGKNAKKENLKPEYRLVDSNGKAHTLAQYHMGGQYVVELDGFVVGLHDDESRVREQIIDIVVYNDFRTNQELLNSEYFDTPQKKRCRDCGYLIEDDNGDWICDDCGKEIHNILDDECSAEYDRV